MTTSNTGDRAQYPASVKTALIAAESQHNKLAERFKLFLSGRDDYFISPLDCTMVIYSAEELITTLQTLKQAVTDRASVQGGAQ